MVLMKRSGKTLKRVHMSENWRLMVEQYSMGSIFAAAAAAATLDPCSSVPVLSHTDLWTPLSRSLARIPHVREQESHVYTNTHTRLHKHIHIYIYIYTCTHVYTHIYRHVCAWVHTNCACVNEHAYCSKMLFVKTHIQVRACGVYMHPDTGAGGGKEHLWALV